jgi:hypothetical protein
VWDGKYAGQAEEGAASASGLDWERVNLHEGESLQGAWSANGNLVYMLAKQQPDDTTGQDKVVVNPNKLLGLAPTSPQMLTEISFFGLDYRAGDQYSNRSSSGPLSRGHPVVAGPGLLTYSTPNGDGSARFLVKSYDGASTVTMAGNGYELYDWSQYTVFRGLR